MKAACLVEAGKPVEVREVGVPEPGPGQVRLKVAACGVCGTDAHYRVGLLPLPVPSILGHEPVGVVEAVGPGVTALRPGDRAGVSWVQGGCGRCGFCRRKKPDYCAEVKSWVTNGGGLAEYIVAEAEGCTLLPEGLAWEDAAPLFCAGYTVMSGYRNGRPRPGDRVAVLGIGGLGHIAIQVAKAMGHEVVAVTRAADKRAECLELGADEVLVVRDHGGDELAAMGGADLVLGTSNSMGETGRIVSGLRPEGRLVSMAIAREPITVDPLFLLDHQLSIIGSQQSSRADLVDILELAAQGRVRPKNEVYGLEDVETVLQRLIAGRVHFRAVVGIGE